MLYEEQLEKMVKNANEAGWRLKPAAQVKKKALENAISLYAAEAKDEHIYAFMDNTIMGKGKAGFLLTDRAVYCQDFSYSKVSDEKTRVSLENIIIFGPATEGERYFQFIYQDGSKQIVYCSNVYREGFMALVQTALGVFEWTEERKAEPAAKKPAKAVEPAVESISEKERKSENTKEDVSARKSDNSAENSQKSVTREKGKSQELKKSAVAEKVYEILADICGSDIFDLPPESNIDDLGLESLDIILLEYAFEDEFNYTINDDEYEFKNLETIEDIIKYVEKRI